MWKERTIAYTIVGAPTAGQAGRRPATWLDGTELRTLTLNGRLSRDVAPRTATPACCPGAGIKAAALQMLAAWKVPADSTDGGLAHQVRATRWRARCRRVVIVASRTRSARAASR